MYILSGFYHFPDSNSGIAIPFFKTPESNSVFVQNVSRGYIISAFLLFDSTEFHTSPDLPPFTVRNVGDSAIFAFRTCGTVHWGSFEELRSTDPCKIIDPNAPFFSHSLASFLGWDDVEQRLRIVSSQSFNRPESRRVWAVCETDSLERDQAFSRTLSSLAKVSVEESIDWLLHNPTEPRWPRVWKKMFLKNKSDDQLPSVGVWWLQLPSYAGRDDATIIESLLLVKQVRIQVADAALQWVEANWASGHLLALRIYRKILIGDLDDDSRDRALAVGMNMLYDAPNIRQSRRDWSAILNAMRRHLPAPATAEVALHGTDLFSWNREIVKKFLLPLLSRSDTKELVREKVRDFVLEGPRNSVGWCQATAKYVLSFPEDSHVYDLAFGALFERESDGAFSVRSTKGWKLLWEACSSKHEKIPNALRELAFDWLAVSDTTGKSWAYVFLHVFDPHIDPHLKRKAYDWLISNNLRVRHYKQMASALNQES